MACSGHSAQESSFVLCALRVSRFASVPTLSSQRERRPDQRGDERGRKHERTNVGRVALQRDALRKLHPAHDPRQTEIESDPPDEHSGDEQDGRAQQDHNDASRSHCGARARTARIALLARIMSKKVPSFATGRISPCMDPSIQSTTDDPSGQVTSENHPSCEHQRDN